MSKAVRRDHLFGISPCLAAILSGRRHLFKLYLNEKLSKEDPQRACLSKMIETAKEKELKIVYKSRKILDRLSGGRPHQNVVLEAGKRSLENVSRNVYGDENKTGLMLALDEIQDPMNLGAIIRSSVYFGVDDIIVNAKNTCGLTPTVSKVSSGALEWASIYSSNSMHKFLKDTVSLGWDVIGTVGFGHNQTTALSEVTPSKRTVLVLGNEGFGLSDSITSLCSQLVTIPPCHHAPSDLDSLNVSVATGVLLHSLLTKQIAFAKQTDISPENTQYSSSIL